MEEKKSRHRVNIDETGRRLKRIWLVENWNGEEEEEEEEGSCQQCWMISAEWPRASCLLRAPLGPQSSSVMCTKKKKREWWKIWSPMWSSFLSIPSMINTTFSWLLFRLPLFSPLPRCPARRVKGKIKRRLFLLPSLLVISSVLDEDEGKKNVNHPNTIWSFKRCPSPPFRLMTIFFLCRVKPSFFKNVLDFLMNFRGFFWEDSWPIPPES